MGESSGELGTEIPINLTKSKVERNDLVERKNADMALPENALPRWIRILIELAEQARERAVSSKPSQ